MAANSLSNTDGLQNAMEDMANAWKKALDPQLRPYINHQPGSIAYNPGARKTQKQLLQEKIDRFNQECYARQGLGVISPSPNPNLIWFNGVAGGTGVV